MKKFLLIIVLALFYGVTNAQELSKKQEKQLKQKFERVDLSNKAHSLVAVAKNGKWGWANVNTYELIIPYQFEELGTLNSSLIFSGKSEGRWDLYSEKGKRLTFGNYEELQANFAGLRGAKKNGKWGYIDDNGNTKIDFKFEYVSAFAPNEVRHGANLGYNGERRKINMQGEFID